MSEDRESFTPACPETPIRASVENMAPSVQANGVDATIAQKHSSPKAQSRVVILTNLPNKLPILPEEIALVQGYFGDLVASILANDNQPE